MAFWQTMTWIDSPTIAETFLCLPFFFLISTRFCEWSFPLDDKRICKWIAYWQFDGMIPWLPIVDLVDFCYSLIKRFVRQEEEKNENAQLKGINFAVTELWPDFYLNTDVSKNCSEYSNNLIIFFFLEWPLSNAICRESHFRLIAFCRTLEMPCDISSTISVALIEVASSNYQLAGLLTYAKSIKSLKTSRRAHLKALPERMTLQNSCRGDVQESGNPQDTHSKAGTAPSDVDDNVTTLNLLEKCKKKKKESSVGFSNSKRVGPDLWVWRGVRGLKWNCHSHKFNYISWEEASDVWHNLKLPINSGDSPKCHPHLQITPPCVCVRAHQLSKLKFQKMSQNLTCTKKSSR